MGDFAQTITIDAVSKIKQNKKGGEFISVKDTSGAWWYVSNKGLFNFFKKGMTVECRVNTNNDFKKIVETLGEGSAQHSPMAKQGASVSTESLERIEEKLNAILNNQEEIKMLINPL